MAFDVFISYAHKDRKLRDELAVHLGKENYSDLLQKMGQKTEVVDQEE